MTKSFREFFLYPMVFIFSLRHQCSIPKSDLTRPVTLVLFTFNNGKIRWVKVRYTFQKSSNQKMKESDSLTVLFVDFLFRRLLGSKAANERSLFDLSIQNQYGKNVLHYLGTNLKRSFLYLGPVRPSVRLDRSER